MSAYSFFASVYDLFMDDIPYLDWADMISEYLSNNGYENTKMLEIGSGTGRFSLLMAAEGYSVTGIDLSKEMIKEAKKKTKIFKVSAGFAVGDMRALDFQGQFNVVVSVCDSINYLLNTDELFDTFKGVYNALEKNGIFIFDMKTEAFFRSLGEELYNDEKEIGEYYWENYYDEDSRNNDYYITFYIKKGKLYEKHIEEHTQHAFRPEEVLSAAEKAGFKVLDNLGMDFTAPADYNSQRVYFILKKEV